MKKTCICLARGFRALPLIALILVALASCAGTGGSGPSATGGAPEAPEALALSILDAVNLQRLQAGVPILSTDPALQALAHQMAGQHTTRHRADLTTVQKANGFAYLNENLYRRSSPPTPDQVVQAWLASDGHRKNLLTERAHLGAVAVSVGDDGYTYVVFNAAAKTTPSSPP